MVLYRSDLDWIAFNTCLMEVQNTEPAEVVTYIVDAFGTQRRWEAGQLRTAALETKCPSA